MKILFPLFIGAALSGTPVIQPEQPMSTGHYHSVFQDVRVVKNFNGVAAGGPLSVIVTLGNKEGISFEGDEEAISTLVAEVKGDVLIIRPKASWKSWSKKYKGKKIIAYVSAKNISSLTMSGDGSLLLKGKANAEKMAATLSGSGSIKAEIDADELTATISGSGSVNLNGSAGHASVTLSGSGKLEGKSLVVNDMDTRISGSGSVYAKVNSKLNALISGSGNVYYSGNPSIEQKVLGSGGVKKL